MSHVVETTSPTDFFEIPVKSNNTQVQEQEINDYTEFLKIEYEKYRRYKILLEGIEECIEDDENFLDEDLRQKSKNIILSGNVSQIKLNDNVGEGPLDNILGIPFDKTEITYSERGKLLSCLKSKLENKSAKLKSDCYSLFGKDINEVDCEKSGSPFDLNPEDVVLLELKNKLAQEQESFMKYQIELLELLEDLKNIRIQTVPDITDQKICECNLRSKINYLKSQLAKDKCKLDVFMETSNSLKAYTEIIKDMKEQRDQLNLEIERLKDLKKKYIEVSCKEYDDILKSYLQYKASLEKKKMMYELYG